MTRASTRCVVSGCNEPRHVSRSGRVYSKCDLHFRQDYQHQYANRRPPPVHRPQRHPSAVGKRIEALVIDWATERIYRVEGVVCTDDPFPLTYGELRKVMAEAAEQGLYVAEPKAYKDEDIYGETVTPDGILRGKDV